VCTLNPPVQDVRKVTATYVPLFRYETAFLKSALPTGKSFRDLYSNKTERNTVAILCVCHCSDCVTIDGVWIELLQNVTTSNYSAVAKSHSAIHYSTHKVFSLLCDQSLSSNGFQHRSFLSFRVYALTGLRLSPS
jgi:hypothetical protein